MCAESTDAEQRQLAENRRSALQAAVKALDRPADVMAAIAAAADHDAAHRAVVNLLGVDDVQARAVLGLKWGSATREHRLQAQNDLEEVESFLRGAH